MTRIHMPIHARPQRQQRPYLGGAPRGVGVLVEDLPGADGGGGRERLGDEGVACAGGFLEARFVDYGVEGWVVKKGCCPRRGGEFGDYRGGCRGIYQSFFGLC